DSPLLPHFIKSIYMTNITAYQGFSNSRSLSNFEIFFDFSRPSLVDLQNVVSSPTANESNVAVQGERASWIAAVVDAVQGIMTDRGTRRAPLHAAMIYDVGLLCVGFPAVLYICVAASEFISRTLPDVHPVIV